MPTTLNSKKINKIKYKHITVAHSFAQSQLLARARTVDAQQNVNEWIR